MTDSRFFYQLTPEYGAGYYLGIAGGILMLLLLVYPLKKRVHRVPLSTKFWFRTHMQLGIIGPLLIVLHSKLNLGSTNSTVAFIFMVTVAVSGLIGRFLYQKVHVSMYGRRRDLSQLLEQLKERIDEREELELALSESLTNAAIGNPRIVTDGSAPRLRALRKSLRDLQNRLSVNGDCPGWLVSVGDLLDRCISLVRYEKLFSLWHYLHLPIFFAFVLATAVHILAVHIY